jgi:CubicO group peptidase (beta-lactamase class C family)
MVTSSLVIMLKEEEPGFSLDDDLRKIMPGMQNPYNPDEPITARHLIMHTAGLADTAVYTEAVGSMKFPSINTILADKGMWLMAKPGERYNYTNFGAGAVSGVIESHSGMRFYDYARTRLFEPLGIDAAYSVQLVKDQSLIASMYDQNLRLTAAPGRWGNMNAVYDAIPLGEMYLLGHGDLFISAKDLAVIGMILAGDGTFKGKRYLTEDALKQMNRLILRDKYTGVTRGLGTFAMTNIVEGRTVYGHQGNAYGMISGMFYDPVTETGVVFLSNGSNASKGEQGLYHVNREIMGEIWKLLI